MRKEEVLAKITNQVLISCQADEASLFYPSEEIAKLASECVAGGAVGLRVNSPENIRSVRSVIGDETIIIGIWKQYSAKSDVYITPSFEAAQEIIEAGANIVALDCTARKNEAGAYGYDLISLIKEAFPHIPIMADCSTVIEGGIAAEKGADIIASTLAGYTHHTKSLLNGKPAFALIKEWKEQLNTKNIKILCEGRIWSTGDMTKAFDSGADVCVIGQAVTSPKAISQKFISASNQYFHKRGI